MILFVVITISPVCFQAPAELAQAEHAVLYLLAYFTSMVCISQCLLYVRVPFMVLHAHSMLSASCTSVVVLPVNIRDIPSVAV